MPDSIKKSASTAPRVINAAADPRVYLLKNGRKRWIANDEVLINLGFDHDDIHTIPLHEIKKIPNGFPISSINEKIIETHEFICCIEKTWSDEFSIGVIGWIVGKKTAVKKLSLSVDGQNKQVTRWTERAHIYDYLKNIKSYKVSKNCGFEVVINRPALHKFGVRVNDSRQSVDFSYNFAKRLKPGDYPVDKDLAKKFQEIVNNNKLSVLEVGSRVSPGGINKRKFFKNAGSYTGVDILPSDTVDVVGDAHELSKLFQDKFDALYSDSVLEHMAAPWKGVIEMNKVLKKGGYVYHSAPSSWVLHDMPWDFWRFSDAGLKALFSKPFGFEVIETEYTSPMNLHINVDTDDSYAGFPLSPAFGFVCILAKKIRNVNPLRMRFGYGLGHVVGRGSNYPKWH